MSIYTQSGFCSGALINENWVLTSAVCAKIGGSIAKIRLGEYDDTVNATEQL